MRQGERDKWMAMLEEDRTRNNEALMVLLGEIQKLADRIQHPEARQVEPGEVKEYDAPTDAGELAQVGQIVYGNGQPDA